MDRETFERQWEGLAEEVVTGMAEWRIQHPKAAFREIEAALDKRLDRMRARMLSDAAMASERTDWSGIVERRPRSVQTARSARNHCRSEVFRSGDCRVKGEPR